MSSHKSQSFGQSDLIPTLLNIEKQCFLSGSEVRNNIGKESNDNKVTAVATVDDVGNAMRSYIMAAAYWIDSLFGLLELDDIEDMILLLRHVLPQYILFQQAVKTSQSNENDGILLCNDTVVSKEPTQDIQNAFKITTSSVSRIIAEVVDPLEALRLSDLEAVLVTSLIVLDPDVPGLSSESSSAILQFRETVQLTLYDVILQIHGMDKSTTRYANSLLIISSTARLSMLVSENVQFAAIFGSNFEPFSLEQFFSSRRSYDRHISSRTN